MTVSKKKNWINNFYVLVVLFILIFLVLTQCSKKDPLNHEERKWLAQHDGKIIIADAPAWPPVAFNEKKKDKTICKGISSEYIGLIEKKLGFKFKRAYPKTWDEMVKGSEQKEIHVIGSIVKTPKRTKYLNFTKPYIKIPNVIIVKEGIKESLILEKLKRRTVAAGKGFAVTEYIKKNHKYLDIDDESDSDLKLMQRVSFGEVDAAIIDLTTASYFIEEKGITNLRIAGEVGYDLELSIASRNDWPMLNRILEKGLDLITQEEKDAIRKKWIKVDYDRSVLPWCYSNN